MSDSKEKKSLIDEAGGKSEVQLTKAEKKAKKKEDTKRQNKAFRYILHYPKQ